MRQSFSQQNASLDKFSNERGAPYHISAQQLILFSFNVGGLKEFVLGLRYPLKEIFPYSFVFSSNSRERVYVRHLACRTCGLLLWQIFQNIFLRFGHLFSTQAGLGFHPLDLGEEGSGRDVHRLAELHELFPYSFQPVEDHGQFGVREEYGLVRADGTLAEIPLGHLLKLDVNAVGEAQ